MDIIKLNSSAWDNQVKMKNRWTIPVSSKEIEKAKTGILDLVLTPNIIVPKNWFDGIKGKKVLALACGGGQQVPQLAAFGCSVTLLDNSKKQIEQDLKVAKRESLNINTVKGSMQDLSMFEDESFDFIFHPVSNCFVDDIKIVWKECNRVLKKGCRIIFGCCNPALFMFDIDVEKHNGGIVAKYKIPYNDKDHKEILEKRIKEKDTIEFSHTLEDQIGSLCKSGFAIIDMYSDRIKDSEESMYIYDAFLAINAIKL